MGPSYRSYVVLALIVLLTVFGARKCSHDMRGDLIREVLISECKLDEPCRQTVLDRVAECFDDRYGLGVFVALSKFDSHVGRNTFNRLMEGAVRECVFSPDKGR